jgi:hypothetical protein
MQLFQHNRDNYLPEIADLATDLATHGSLAMGIQDLVKLSSLSRRLFLYELAIEQDSLRTISFTSYSPLYSTALCCYLFRMGRLSLLRTIQSQTRQIEFWDVLGHPLLPAIASFSTGSLGGLASYLVQKGLPTAIDLMWRLLVRQNRSDALDIFNAIKLDCDTALRIIEAVPIGLHASNPPLSE